MLEITGRNGNLIQSFQKGDKSTLTVTCVAQTFRLRKSYFAYAINSSQQ